MIGRTDFDERGTISLGSKADGDPTHQSFVDIDPFAGAADRREAVKRSHVQPNTRAHPGGF